MVTGLNIFRDYFAEDTDKYVLIGGAACDIVFTTLTSERRILILSIQRKQSQHICLKQARLTGSICIP